MKEQSQKRTIGRAEVVEFPGLETTVHARIDSGARTSAIWVSHAKVEDGKLEVIFFGKGNPGYTGEKHYFESYGRDIVISSNGHKQQRYKIKTLVKLKGKKIRASFTLADRSTQVYPVLIGRNVLRGKFIVDVQFGKTLKEEEKALRLQKQKELNGETL